VNAPSGSGGSLSALPPAPNATVPYPITATSEKVISLIFFISFISFYKAFFILSPLYHNFLYAA
jgi:hypothetical protein